jgi:predicted secreted protein
MTTRTVLGGFCTLLVVAMSAVAQPDSLWTRIYGGPGNDRGLSVLPLEDGGFLVSGATASFGSGDADFWLIQTDSNGDSLWSRTYGGPLQDAAASVLPAQGGGYWISGHTLNYGAGERDWLLIRLDENGDSLWSRTFGGEDNEWGGRLHATSDGGFFLEGQLGDPSLGAQFGLIKINANGDSLWGRNFGGPEHEGCFDGEQTDDGGYILSGTTMSFGAGDRDMWLVKTDENGDSLWSRTFGGELEDWCYGVAETSDGGCVLAGHTRSFGAGGADVWLIRTDSNGDSLWSRIFGGEADDYCRDVRITKDGGIILAGFTYSFGSGGGDAWLIKTDANGDSLWSATYGVPEYDERFYSIVQTADSGFIMVGLLHDPAIPQEDLLMMRTGPDPIIPFPPGAFERVLPEDSTLFDVPDVEFTWTQSVDPNGDQVTYLLHLESPTYTFLDTTDYTTTDTSIIVHIPWPLEHVDEIHAFYWTVHAAAAGDTVEASNGEGIFYMDIIGAADVASVVPLEYRLAAYPNPFNPSTQITFDLPKASHVTLGVFDLLGREVGILTDEAYPAGTHSATFDGSNLSSGIYFYRLQAGDFVQAKKMVLLK